jgi:hypothetical protein
MYLKHLGIATNLVVHVDILSPGTIMQYLISLILQENLLGAYTSMANGNTFSLKLKSIMFNDILKLIHITY